mmetsp:Transcript_718/g.1001  ORF Transcript_718/g.1001 Transcript_718/m.1001 type:complete len:246 (+) Transcript_718:538-1275(+)
MFHADLSFVFDFQASAIARESLLENVGEFSSIREFVFSTSNGSPPSASKKRSTDPVIDSRSIGFFASCQESSRVTAKNRFVSIISCGDAINSIAIMLRKAFWSPLCVFSYFNRRAGTLLSSVSLESTLLNTFGNKVSFVTISWISKLVSAKLHVNEPSAFALSEVFTFPIPIVVIGRIPLRNSTLKAPKTKLRSHSQESLVSSNSSVCFRLIDSSSLLSSRVKVIGTSSSVSVLCASELPKNIDI